MTLFWYVLSTYRLICTRLYYYTIPVPVCTWYVRVRTGSEPVRTKYPIPVMRFTIPDALTTELQCWESEAARGGALAGAA
jgi:hypothetical protein